MESIGIYSEFVGMNKLTDKESVIRVRLAYFDEDMIDFRVIPEAQKRIRKSDVCIKDIGSIVVDINDKI
jgi:hypothetical protein